MAWAGTEKGKLYFIVVKIRWCHEHCEERLKWPIFLAYPPTLGTVQRTLFLFPICVLKFPVLTCCAPFCNENYKSL